VNTYLPWPFVLVCVGVIAFSIAVPIWWQWRRTGNFTTMFLWGGLLAIAVWALGIALIPLRGWLGGELPNYAVVLWILAFMLVDTGAVYLIILCGALTPPLRRASWEGAVAVGLSYGSTGNVVLVSHLLLIQMGLVTFPNLGRFPLATSRYVLASRIVSRLSLIPAIAIAALACVLIIYAVQTKSWKWFALGFVWLLAGPGFGYFWMILRVPGRYTEAGTMASKIIESGFGMIGPLIFGAIGLWGIRAMRRRWASGLVEEEAPH